MALSASVTSPQLERTRLDNVLVNYRVRLLSFLIAHYVRF